MAVALPRDEPASGRSARFGDFRFDLDGRLLHRGDLEVSLAPRAAAVLAVLLDRAGRVVSKDELVDRAWRGAFISEAAIAEGIRQIRLALGDDAAAPRFVQTLHRRGYRFIAPVDWRSGGPAAPDAETPFPASPGAMEAADAPGRPAAWSRAGRLAGTAALVGLVAAGALLALRGRPGLRGAAGGAPGDRDAAGSGGPGLVRFDVTLPASALELQSMALAPDGRRLAFVLGGDQGTNRRLYLRRLDQPDLVEVPGAAGASHPFFAPSGESIGYLAGGRLWTLGLDAGPPRALAPIGLATAAVWMPDDRIIVATLGPVELWEVAARGGSRRRLATLRNEGGRWRIGGLAALPDGTLVASMWSTSIDEARLERFDPVDGSWRTLLEGAAEPSWAAGRLHYARADGLYSARWTGDGLADETRTGEAVQVLPTLGARGFTTAAAGGLVYVRQPPPPLVEVLWVDARGRTRSVLRREDHWAQARISPRGDQLAVVALDGTASVWVYDLETGSDGRDRRRLTFDGFNILPFWSPRAAEVCYAARLTATYDIRCRDARGEGPSRALLESGVNEYPSAFSPDGEWAFYVRDDPRSRRDVWRVSRTGDRNEPFLVLPGDQDGARVSPDGRWILYRSNETGEPEVWVDSYPRASRRRWVGAGAFGEPTWGDSGRRIAWGQDPAGVASVRFDPTSGSVGPVERLFEGDWLAVQADPASDRILVVRRFPSRKEPLVLRWVLPQA